MRNFLFFTLTLLSTLVVSTPTNADIIHEVGDSNGAALPLGLASTDGVRTSFDSFQNGDQTTNDLIFTGVTQTSEDTGTTVSFDVTFSAVDDAGVSLDLLAAAGNTNGSLLTTGGLFTNGDILSITVSGLTVVGDPTNTATATFDGFVDIGTDATGNNLGEGIDVPGIGVVTRGGASTPSTFGPENDPRQGIHGGNIDDDLLRPIPLFDTGSTTSITFVGASQAFRAVAFQITTTPAVPEPSSALILCGVGVFGLLRRRR